MTTRVRRFEVGAGGPGGQPPGGPSVVDRLVVAIRDHGPGVSDVARERLFDRFATGAANGGTGLGLNVARGLLQAMGGSIVVEHPGEGAAFVFTIPAERPEEA